MRQQDLDVNLLFSSEVRALLDERGLTVKVQVMAANGEPADPDVCEELTAALRRVEPHMSHMRQLATIGEVSAGVLHEARNLLTGVVGLSTIRSNDESHIELLRNEAARCSKLLTTFLDSASRAPAYPVLVEPRELLEGVATLLGYEARRHRCQLKTLVADDVTALRAHAHELQQVMLNLTLNAIQASPEGGEITLSATCEADEVVFSVADQGPGVPADMLHCIFEPFVSGKAPSHGTGLGLSTSRQLASAMRGSLSVANRVAGGAVFSLKVPCHAEVPQTLPPGALGP